ncbi:hypothetical protein JOF56_000228 [Kibdelosporangium banguiense]|uniref:Uncharacterized protein n=1 Tax=Kibdelosporangium banguiense TaxID=1365924 RepID=A0ABS4T5Y6_9PSEU|nr:hypothetical protein [Kibdelosporangium banguiense]MBP2319843.1 hypothetical protein [Kibdelosporangium banguiense]
MKAQVLVVMVITVVTTALMSALPAKAVEAQVWAFLYADRLATASYQPANQAASRPDIRSSVTRTSTGAYRVNITGAGSPGVPIVTAVGGSGVHCQLTRFGQNGTAEDVLVNCYSGMQPRDSKFTLSFFYSAPPDSGAPGAYGYVYNNEPKLTTYVNPPLRYNSTGGNVEIYYNPAAGIWTARFFGQAFINIAGSVQVSSAGPTPARCAIFQWYPHELGADAQVRCDPLSAAAGPPQWTLVYMHERSIVGDRNGFFGYLQANQPTSPSYTPNPDRNRAPNGLLHRITRSGPGVYQVEIYGPLKAPNTVHLTVNGNTSAFCNIVGWTLKPGSQPAGLIDITCFDANGTPADNWFSLAYYSP